MTKFEGPIKPIPYSSEIVYKFLSSFDNFEDLLPAEHVEDWQSNGDSCRFKVSGVGEVGLRIIEKEELKTIKYSADGKTPFNFFLWIQLKEKANDDSRVRLTIKADLNPMIKMVVATPITKFLEVLTEAIASHNYPS